MSDILLSHNDYNLLSGTSICNDCGESLCRACKDRREKLIAYLKTNSRHAARSTCVEYQAKQLADFIVESHRANPNAMKSVLWLSVVKAAETLQKITE